LAHPYFDEQCPVPQAQLAKNSSQSEISFSIETMAVQDSAIDCRVRPSTQFFNSVFYKVETARENWASFK
jgi:hypothetical protein